MCFLMPQDTDTIVIIVLDMKCSYSPYSNNNKKSIDLSLSALWHKFLSKKMIRDGHFFHDIIGLGEIILCHAYIPG